jgi:uncharacterized protein YutE (UPF0331/DUF86 family)
VDDVLLNKAATIERCLQRIDQEYKGHEAELDRNFTRQDAIILNLQRACETAIDAAMHLVRTRRLGLPQESREAFTLLEGVGLIGSSMAVRMRAMVGFRNVAVHDYIRLNLEIVRAIVARHLDDLRAFATTIIRHAGTESG